MKMYRIILLTIILAGRVNAQDGYTIDGKIPSSQNGKFIYLFGIDYADLSPKIRDSALITDGKFRFSGKINTPAILASIYLKENRLFFSQFFIENKRIELTANLRDSTNPFATVVTTNNPVTRQYEEWKKKQDEFIGIYRRIVVAGLAPAFTAESAKSTALQLVTNTTTCLLNPLLWRGRGGFQAGLCGFSAKNMKVIK